jgi:RNA exonuclease 1
MTTDGKALTLVCIVDVDTGKVVYDQLVKPPAQLPIISRGKFISHLSYFSHLQFLRSKLSRDDGCSANKNICQRADASPHADNAFDDRARSFIRIGSENPKLWHPRYIDTALIFRHPRGRLSSRD